MKRIEDLVQQLHQEAKAKGAFRSSPSSSSSSIPPQARTEGRQPPLPTASSAMEVVGGAAAESTTHPPTSSTASNKQPFAVIDQVFRTSPAEEAGLKEGDLLVGFGSVDADNHSNLSAVSPPTHPPSFFFSASYPFLSPQIVQLVQNSVGRPIRVVVQRKEEGGGGVGKKEVVVALTPHTWSGRGLLGCHLAALSS